MRGWWHRISEWFSDDFTDWLSVYATIHFWILLAFSLGGNIYQYSFYRGYDKNVGIVVDAYQQEQLENFDLNRAIHEKNLFILDLNKRLQECLAVVNIIQDESDGMIVVEHILE